MPPSFSVVICAYTADRWEHLINAVASVRQQTIPAREIVVVIDHYAPLLEQARAAFADLLVLENTEAHGLSGARNCGIQAATGDVIAFLDDDAVATTTWIADLQRAYDDPRVVGVGGAVTPSWESARPRWFPAEFDWVVGCTYRGMPETAAPVRNLIGANMSFRRSLFASIGGFRSGVGQVGASMMRCDDTELCIGSISSCPRRRSATTPARASRTSSRTRGRAGRTFGRAATPRAWRRRGSPGSSGAHRPRGHRLLAAADARHALPRAPPAASRSRCGRR